MINYRVPDLHALLAAKRGDRTLFTTAGGIERLRQVAYPLLI